MIHENFFEPTKGETSLRKMTGMDFPAVTLRGAANKA